MFQLDDNFLNDVGMGNLPADEKDAFLQHIYQELELRVGTELAKDLDDAQLSEFEGLIGGDEAKVTLWLQNNVENYQASEEYKSVVARAAGDDSKVNVLQAEYAATRWLETNRPNYRDVVAAKLAELKQEIIDNRDTFIQPAGA